MSAGGNCLDRAVKQRQLERALDKQIEEDVVAQLRRQIAHGPRLVKPDE